MLQNSVHLLKLAGRLATRGAVLHVPKFSHPSSSKSSSIFQFHAWPIARSRREGQKCASDQSQSACQTRQTIESCTGTSSFVGSLVPQAIYAHRDQRRRQREDAKLPRAHAEFRSGSQDLGLLLLQLRRSGCVGVDAEAGERHRPFEGSVSARALLKMMEGSPRNGGGECAAYPSSDKTDSRLPCRGQRWPDRL